MRRHHVILGIAAVSFAFAAFLLATGFYAWAFLEAATGLVALLVARRVARPSWDYDGPAAPPPPAAPFALAEEDLAAVPEPVVACPHCGYLGIRAPTMGDGGVPGVSELLDKRVCRRCGYQGLPVEFATREDYRGFLRDLSAA